MAEAPIADAPEEGLRAERMPWATLARALAFALVMAGAVVGLHGYIGARIFEALGLSEIGRSAGWLGMAGLFLLVPAAFAVRMVPVPALQALVRWAAFLWMGLFALLMSAVAAVDLATVAADGAFAAPRPAGAARWGHVQAVAVAALVLPAFAWGLYRARGRPRVERMRFRVASLGAGLDGFRIVQISDLHVGETLGRDWVERLVEQVNALDPDVVAITGDLADGRPSDLADEVEPLRRLRAKHGVYFVTGNHEYFSGVHAWERKVRDLGIDVLKNEHRVLSQGGDRLVLAGVTDYNAGQFLAAEESRPDVAFRGAPAGLPRILLAHQPRTAFAAAGQGVDLMLAGHNHGGQIFPWMFLVRLQQPVIRGLHRVAGVPVYAHRGTGYWGPPLRVGAPPEIAVIELTRPEPGGR